MFAGYKITVSGCQKKRMIMLVITSQSQLHNRPHMVEAHHFSALWWDLFVTCTIVCSKSNFFISYSKFLWLVKYLLLLLRIKKAWIKCWNYVMYVAAYGMVATDCIVTLGVISSALCQQTRLKLFFGWRESSQFFLPSASSCQYLGKSLG